jgi:hypothetical protein
MERRREILAACKFQRFRRTGMLSPCLQLAKVLLQLHHHQPCVSVCLKALTDAARAGDVAWSAQLLGLQAAALVAQEEYLPALNCYRAALARWVLIICKGVVCGGAACDVFVRNMAGDGRAHCKYNCLLV